MRVTVGIYIAIFIILLALWPVTGGVSGGIIPYVVAVAILHGIGYVIKS